MKTKIIAIFITAVLLLASCVPAVEVSGPDDQQSTEPSQSEVSASEPSQPEESVTDPEVSDEDPSEPEVSDEPSEPEVSVPDEVPSGIYSGQGTDTLGVDRSDLQDFLEDSLFVGDSVTDGFKLYVNNYGDMPSVNFFSCASYGFINACRDKESSDLHPKIGGETKYIWEAVEYYQAERVFINFGLNDYGYATDSMIQTSLDKICSEIHNVSPSTEIVFLSSGFFTREAREQGKGVDNDRVRNKNEYVLNYCDENGYDFIDVSWAFADNDGYLRKEFSYDNYCHLNYKDYVLWEEILMAYAAEKILGQYENIETMLK